MNRVAASALHLITAQVVVTVGQLLYSAVTARSLMPADFGNFAVALSLVGILNLVLVTGFSSLLLSSADLNSGTVRRIRISAVVGGPILAGAYFVLSPLWFWVLDTSGAATYAAFMAATVAIAPISAVESALLRREHKSVLDATAVVAGFTVATGLATLWILSDQDPRALGLVPVVQPLVVLVISLSTRKIRYGRSNTRSQPIWGYASKVSIQSVLFLVIASLPTWVIARACGAYDLGQYTRAVALTLLIATALVTAVNRGVQPFWRRIIENADRRQAVADIVVLSLSFSLFLFSMVAVVSLPLFTLWLGPGWELAAKLASVLAVGCIFQIPSAVLANALEMYGEFEAIRWSQIVSVVTMVPFLAFAVMNADVVAGALSTPVSQISGFITLVAVSRLGKRCFDRKRSFAILCQLFIAILPILLMSWTFWLYRLLVNSHGLVDSNLILLTVVIGVGILGQITFTPFSPAYRVAVRRGLVPGVILNFFNFRIYV